MLTDESRSVLLVTDHCDPAVVGPAPLATSFPPPAQTTTTLRTLGEHGQVINAVLRLVTSGTHFGILIPAF